MPFGFQGKYVKCNPKKNKAVKKITQDLIK